MSERQGSMLKGAQEFCKTQQLCVMIWSSFPILHRLLAIVKAIGYADIISSVSPQPSMVAKGYVVVW